MTEKTGRRIVKTFPVHDAGSLRPRPFAKPKATNDGLPLADRIGEKVGASASQEITGSQSAGNRDRFALFFQKLGARQGGKEIRKKKVRRIGRPSAPEKTIAKLKDLLKQQLLHHTTTKTPDTELPRSTVKTTKLQKDPTEVPKPSPSLKDLLRQKLKLLTTPSTATEEEKTPKLQESSGAPKEFQCIFCKNSKQSGLTIKIDGEDIERRVLLPSFPAVPASSTETPPRPPVHLHLPNTADNRVKTPKSLEVQSGIMELLKEKSVASVRKVVDSVTATPTPPRSDSARPLPREESRQEGAAVGQEFFFGENYFDRSGSSYSYSITL